MKIRKSWLGSVAPLAVIVALGSPVWAGTLDDEVLIGTSGDGFVFSDPAEGVLPPGVKAITGMSWNDGDPIVIDPLVTDFSTLSSRGDVTNCLIANKPSVYCDSPGGSGKRVKMRLTGRNPFDMRLATTPSTEYPTVDYFTFGKISN
jgi:hypothetical protein